MKLAAVLQLLLLTVTAVRAAPSPLANHERHVCSHGAAQSHPIEVKQSNLKETQLMLDFDDVEHLEQEEKLAEDEKQRHHYRGRDFGPELQLQDQVQHDPRQHVESRPNHIPCRMRHTDQSFSSRSDQDLPVLDHQTLLYKRAADSSSTTASPHLDVLNPVDKVYDSPVPELKGGVRRRSAEGRSTAPEEASIKWVPPPADMPVSEDYEDEQSTLEPKQNDDPEKISAEDAHPQKVEDDKGVPKKRYAVDVEQSPRRHLRDLKEIAKSDAEIPKLIKSEVFEPKKEDVRRERSADTETSSHCPPKATAESSEVNAPTSAPKKRSLDMEKTADRVSSDEGAPETSAPIEHSAHVKRSAEHDDTHKDVKEDAPESSSPSVTESVTSEPKNARRRRSVGNEDSATAIPSKPSSDEGALPTPAPIEHSAHVKRSAEQDDTHKDVNEDAPESSSPSVTESVTSEPKNARRRRSVGNEDSATAIPSKPSSDEGALPTSAPIEHSAHAKRSAEHDDTHKDVNEDAPESSSPSVTESVTSEPKKELRRRSAGNEDSKTAIPSKPSSDEGALPTSAPIEHSAHAKRSAEHDDTHKDVNEDAPESSSPSVTESVTSEPKKELRRRSAGNEDSKTAIPSKPSSDEGAPSEPKNARRRRSVGNEDSTTAIPSKPSSDEGALPTSAPIEHSAHAKRAAEHEDTHKDVKEDAPESFSPSVTGPATPESKNARRRRSTGNEESATATSSKASSDESAPATSAPKESNTNVKRSADHEETHKDIKEGAPDSSSPSVTESATSEPKKARRRRSVGNEDSATTSPSKPSSEEAEHDETHKDVKEDVPESSSSSVTESATSEPKNVRRRRSVGSEDSATDIPSKPSSDEAEHDKTQKDVKEDAPDSSSPSATESESKKARRRRSVGNEDSAATTPSKASSDEAVPATSAPKESNTHVKRSPEHEKSSKDVEEDAPEPSSPSVTESAKSEPEKAHKRSVGSSDKCSHTSFSKENNAYVKRSAEHEVAHQSINEDTDETSTSVETKSETPNPKKEGTRRRRSVGSEEHPEHERLGKTYMIDAPAAVDTSDEQEEFRQIRSEKDEEKSQDDTTEEMVQEKATKEPTLKREIRRRRREAENNGQAKLKEEDAPEEASDSPKTEKPCDKKAKRAAVNAGQVLDVAELQKQLPRSRIEALIMGEEGNCCKGRHPPGMHDNSLK